MRACLRPEDKHSGTQNNKNFDGDDNGDVSFEPVSNHGQSIDESRLKVLIYIKFVDVRS